MEREQRRQIARMGAAANLAKYGGAAVAGRARAGFLRRFEREVDPAGILDPRERAERAHYAMTAYMRRLAYTRQRERQFERSEEQIATSIRQIARPVAACADCYAEFGERFPRNATHCYCDRHAAQAIHAVAALVA
jgi:hypothetical protein